MIICRDCGHEMFLVEDHGDPLCDVFYCEICDAFEETNCEPLDAAAPDLADPDEPIDPVWSES
jgi:hypothetical protein